MERSEAIEVLKDFWSVYEVGTKIREAFETLIPEIKVSEDERIRKEIVGFLDMINKESLEVRNFIADRCGDAIPDDMIPTWIAWLEKQGEQNEHTKHPDMVANLKEYLANTPKEQLEKDWDELKHWNNVGPTVEEFLYRKQSPAWSEEDEATISRAISIVKWAVNGNPSYAIINKQGADELVERLNSLKERVQPQQEWSEDDEKMFEFWNLYYEHKVGDMPNKDVVESLEKFRDWLKSLKDKFAWKPSDEQMKCLLNAEGVLRAESRIAMAQKLSSLYNDLKKLTE